MAGFAFDRKKTGLIIVDVQEKLYPKIDRYEELFQSLCKVIRGCRILEIPIVVSEQYPQGLGETLPQLVQLVGENAVKLTKTSFSCLGDAQCKEELLKMPVSQWIVVGIEAHVCVLQTARDLIHEGKEVAVINDAVGSRSIYDFSSAIAEYRDMGARVSSAETLLFELVRDSKAPEFKEISKLVQCAQCTC